MKWFVLLLVSAAAACGTTYNSDGSRADVQSKMTSASGAGDIVTIPAGTFDWTSGVTWNAPVGATLRGAGTAATGGGDQTIITDSVASGVPLLTLNIAATGAFRMTGITVATGTGAGVKDNGTIAIIGPGNLRIDHCHFDLTTIYNAHIYTLGTAVYGVMDHCLLDVAISGAIYPENGRFGEGEVQGNYEWSLPTNLGDEHFFFIEDNIFNGEQTYHSSRLFDGFSAARVVVRFNTCSKITLSETHSTGHAGDDRGLRAQEVYGNVVTGIAESEPNNAAVALFSGTGVAWGNSWDQAYKSIFTINYTRKDSVTYAMSPTPDGWGYSGGVPLATGTVNVTGSGVTWVSGDHFNVSWPVGSMIYIVGATAEGVSGQAPVDGPSCGIASVNSTTSITLANGGHTGSPLTGATYYVGSAWDGNTDVYGYPAIDQLGRGQGDLLTGDFPGKINSTTGTVHWPNQVLEPFYIWNNAGSVVAGWGGGTYSNNSGGKVSENRDYYQQASGIQTNATTPFNGTTGTGWGTLANRPTTCTTGVAYFATDQGSWNTSSTNPHGVQQSGADGLLYKATSTNTWTLYYTPYTYPHPLNVATGTINATTVNATTLNVP